MRAAAAPVTSTGHTTNRYVNAGAMVSMSLISGETAEERYTKFVDLAAQMSSPDSTHEVRRRSRVRAPSGRARTSILQPSAPMRAAPAIQCMPTD